MWRRQGLLFIAAGDHRAGRADRLSGRLYGVLSVTDEQGDFVGLKNYSRDGLGARDRHAVWNTAYYVGGSIVFQVLLGTAAGILLNQKFRGRGRRRAR